MKRSSSKCLPLRLGLKIRSAYNTSSGMSSRKRQRAASMESLILHTALRAALAKRYLEDACPPSWRAAADAAGAPGADAFLCHLGRSIATALQSVPAKAEAARTQLRSTRAALLSAVNSRCDELEAAIAAAETAKIHALECELCAVDAALECWRAEREAAAEAATALGDAELEVRHAELMARLDSAEAQLANVPTTSIEPPHIGLVLDSPALLTRISAFGRVVAPRAVIASDVSFQGHPLVTRPGRTLRLFLLIQGDRHAHQSAEELEVSLGAAAAAAHVEVSLTSAGTAPLLLPVAFSADITRRRVLISIAVPASAHVGTSVSFGPLTLSGRPVAGVQAAISLEPAGPGDLTLGQAAQLQAWLPPGGTFDPSSWEEVYNSTTHGFGAAAFHARCDGRTRLLVLFRALETEGGWLFGGFTAVGFSLPAGVKADPSAFLFSLTNSLGYPEKLDSEHTGSDLYYEPLSVCFGCNQDFWINGSGSGGSTNTGRYYAKSASTGVHPMAQGLQVGWHAAELIAWVV